MKKRIGVGLIVLVVLGGMAVAGEMVPALGTEVIVTGVPDYNWWHGCGPTAIGMIVGYYDTNGPGLDWLIPGDASTQTAAVNAAIASSGHIADYVPTPDRTPPPAYHVDDCIADFSFCSRIPDNWGWSSFGHQDDGFEDYVTWADVQYGGNLLSVDAWNETLGDLTFLDLQAEIDAGYPMEFLVDSSGDGGTDHFVAVVGYALTQTGAPLYGFRDTWSPANIRWAEFMPMEASDPWGVYGGTYFRIEGTVVPEPATFVMFGLGLVGAAAALRRRRSRA